MSDTLNPQEMAPAFDPQPVEAKWSAFWLENEIGVPRAPQNGEKTFVITIPPPNVTGVLHLGHALQHSIHDCLLRYHRMKGEPTLCVPGTDHAGIGTQIKVEAQLREEEGKTRHDLGREEFVRRTQEWKEKYGGTIIEQMKALGCSYDWSRERYTMDEGYIKAVLTVFKEWFERDLICRGYRLVNWSSGAQTTVSDLEIETKEVTGSLTYIKYPVENSQEFVVVATTRPETMLGDTAVAVHPKDARYAHLRGKNVVLPLQNRAIPIVFDDAVSMEFGTGAVKITPAHDQSDYEMGQRHGLPMISVIGFDDKITSEGGIYAGTDKIAARKQIVADLRALGLVEKVEPLTHSVPHCQRTGVVIEPLLSEQWFVKMKKLAEPVAETLRKSNSGHLKSVRYLPPRFANTSLEWLDNIRDWCISRQLWWGHRIPIWYGPNGEVKCSLEPIEGYTQDEDVLDTWFSSALWPFAVLGWPDNFEKEWYPTSVLITGRDILNLWVSRMITTSLYFVKDEHGNAEIPFHDVFVHPTVQDVFGLRMSKSLGTGIDPMELIAIYGADATRYGLLQLTTGAQDVRFIDAAESKLGEDAVRRFMRENRGKPLPLSWDDKDGKPTERYPQMQQARNFANKIWNAARLVLSGQPSTFNGKIPREDATEWIAYRLGEVASEVTRALKRYEFEVAAKNLYQFIWNDFCDYFLEIVKPQLRSQDEVYSAFTAHIFEVSMRLLHPFMPFLTEEIWQMLPKNDVATNTISQAKWPYPDADSDEDYWGMYNLINDPRADIQPQEEGGVLIYYRLPEIKTKGEHILCFRQNLQISKDRFENIFKPAVLFTRNLRAQATNNSRSKVRVIFSAQSERAAVALRDNQHRLTQLANLESASIVFGVFERPQNAISAQLSEIEVILPLEGLIDVEAERQKLEKQLETARKEHEKVVAKLSNESFTAKAPPAVVAENRARLADFAAQIEKLTERLAAL